MDGRRSILDLIAIALGIVVIFSASAFAQGLVKGTAPAETSISTAPAYCSELSGAFRVCRVRLNEEGDAEFQVQKLGVTVGRTRADFWANVAVEPKDFLAYRGDMDRDGRSEVVLVSLDSVSQGMGVSYSTAYIFDGRRVESGGAPITIPIQEFGDGENFVYDRTSGRTRVLVTYWADYDSIEPKRGSGLYLIGKWFAYRNGRLNADLGQPTLARRFLNSFAAERDSLWFENRKPYTWLKNRRTVRVFREPIPKGKLISTMVGKIAGVDENSEHTELKVEVRTGETLDLRLHRSLSTEAKDGVPSVRAIGIASRRYLYPHPRTGGFLMSAFAERFRGRLVRVETYKPEYGDSYSLLWLLD